MDVLVEEGEDVHGAVRPVMPCVLHNEEDCDLVSHCEDGREWDGGAETAELGHWVEKPANLLAVIFRTASKTYQICGSSTVK